jgi:N utilization substance protein A
MTNDDAESVDEVRRVFEKHVPDVASGTVQLVAIAREPGRRVYVAVRSNDPAVNAVSACVGKGGIQPKGIVRDLGGEHLSIVLWDASDERFILNALSGLLRESTPKVFLNPTTRVAAIALAPRIVPPAELNLHLRLTSQLVGWTIELIDP